MGEGRVVQTATPDELWAHPRDVDVARFLGLGNVEGATAVRAEAVSVRPASGTGSGQVERAVRTGPVVRLVVRLDDGRRLEALSTSLEHPSAGDRVDVDVDPDGIIRLP
jgi:ABC-type Fe3+/spermidine/putrescine transport system ATPase subunit